VLSPLNEIHPWFKTIRSISPWLSFFLFLITKRNQIWILGSFFFSGKSEAKNQLIKMGILKRLKNFRLAVKIKYSLSLYCKKNRTFK
jgi:hypothetical protein